MRLNKYLAHAGIASRRGADKMIEDGQVKINGEIVRKLATIVNEERDTVEVSGQKLTLANNFVVYLLNKPRGVITTASDPQHRPTVMDFIPKEPRVVPCGRLDEETQGLVVLTNDGNLCYQLTHPKYEHEKVYFVEGITRDPLGAVKKMSEPLKLKDGPVQIDKLEVEKQSGNKLNFYITIHDGRNRIVRRICAECDVEVHSLTRTKLGQYELGDLAPGKFKTV
jgi:pseudouridine synthase